jgi:uncharacterized protein YkwD
MRRFLFGSNQQEWRLIQVAAGLCLISIVTFVVFLFQANSFYIEQKNQDIFTLQQLHSVINRERVKRDLSTLAVNDSLNNAAQKKAEDMATKSYFSHISPIDGKQWKSFIQESGYEYKEAGENLANGYDNVEEMTTAWLDSPSHRENLLNPSVDETGFGIKYGLLDGYPTVFVVQMFGQQQTEQVNIIRVQ